jgi:hypothetical protein
MGWLKRSRCGCGRECFECFRLLFLDALFLVNVSPERSKRAV